LPHQKTKSDAGNASKSTIKQVEMGQF